ncbi:MAG: TIGR00725 family protein [Fimbriimonas ginsengisoli]|uniref:TIGR00725 family protein n=1 Tax=Fimbriimonas ginsengisoli TaxID=1005039 RepID=A0A931LW95_FIMGI|nr:TIGR00725 family protein [Fimbriimonas ginsengisoli]
MKGRLIAVVGAAKCDSATASVAGEVGRLLAEAGAVVVCGGLGGVMEAACQGASEAGGLTVGLLPGKDPADANRFVSVPIATGLGEARNSVIAHACAGMIAVGGEYGTLSEIALALKLGKPVVGLGTWSLSRGGRVDGGIVAAATPVEAMHALLRLL